MPSSHLYQVLDIMELVLFTEPQSILDIGVGFGKYGFLSREYLEVWNKERKYCDWKVRIDGIEVFSNYLTPVHHFIYDNVHIGNAINILPNLNMVYDLILLIDVLEHLEFDQGMMLLRECVKICKNMVVATPRDIGCQKDVFGNPFEVHRSQWKEPDLWFLKNLCFIPNKISIICYIGERAHKLKRSRINRRIGKYFPFLVPIVKLIKSCSSKL